MSFLIKGGLTPNIKNHKIWFYTIVSEPLELRIRTPKCGRVNVHSMYSYYLESPIKKAKTFRICLASK